MNIIIFSHKRGGTRSLNLAHPLPLCAVAVATLGVLGAAFAAGMQLGERSGRLAADPQHWGRILADQKSEIEGLRARVQERVDAIGARLGQLDARVIRIDALGRRLASLANLDKRAFNFDADPAPAPAPDAAPGAPGVPDLTQALGDLEQQVNLRDAQLSAMENVLVERRTTEAVHPAGKPVDQGYISSRFGEREDPFDGHDAFHKGIDFAGSAGDPVRAVAAGVVTWAGPRTGYGTLVEINHGNGYVTRYAHNESTLVSVGQTVTRGQQIALMGSTGRSTGPHVHFEVRRDGRAVDPMSFVTHPSATPSG